MPNWCDCDLNTMGIKEKLLEFKNFNGGNPLDANIYVPYPKKYKKLDEAAEKWESEHPGEPCPFKDGLNSGGFGWCCDNWGTVRGFVEPRLMKFNTDFDELFYTFKTASGPPIPLIFAMSTKFPELELQLTYFESGMMFHAIYRVKDGKVIQDAWGKYYGDRGG